MVGSHFYNGLDGNRIAQANALFYCQDADLHVADPFRLYNGLPYLGVFGAP